MPWHKQAKKDVSGKKRPELERLTDVHAKAVDNREQAEAQLAKATATLNEIDTVIKKLSKSDKEKEKLEAEYGIIGTTSPMEKTQRALPFNDSYSLPCSMMSLLRQPSAWTG